MPSSLMRLNWSLWLTKEVEEKGREQSSGRGQVVEVEGRGKEKVTMTYGKVR